MQDSLSAADTPLFGIYSPEVPEFVNKIASAPELLKLRDVGMHCGCEYTSLPCFSGLAHSSRYSHSIGVGLIVWNFTRNAAQTVSGLLHDIATPAFSHVVDFLRGDHMRQESTESRTSEIIRNSRVITGVLSELGLDVADVDDYHLYPIADNDSPKLSADRLEYTLGNILNFRLGTSGTVKRLYDNIEVGINEYGETELVFTNRKEASDFAFFALECGKVYTCDDDRYAMQTLAEILRTALRKGVIKAGQLYLTESEVIARLKSDTECSSMWNIYCNMDKVSRCGADTDDGRNILRSNLLVPRIIHAKKRYIDPYVKDSVNGTGRVLSFDPEFKKAVGEFLSAGHDYRICGESKAF